MVRFIILRPSTPFWKSNDKIFGGVTNFQNRFNNEIIKRVNINKAPFSPRDLNFILQKSGLLISTKKYFCPDFCKMKSPKFCIFYFKSWGVPHFCISFLQNSGQKYFFVEIKSPHFCKMKFKSRGEKGALFMLTRFKIKAIFIYPFDFILTDQNTVIIHVFVIWLHLLLPPLERILVSNASVCYLPFSFVNPTFLSVV